MVTDIMGEQLRKTLETVGTCIAGETSTEKAKRYGQALDQIIARPPYPIALRIAHAARYPEKKESK